MLVVVVVVGEVARGGRGGGRGGNRGGRLGRGGGQGGRGGGVGGAGGRGQTAEFAPSSVNAASCRLGVLHEKQNPVRALWCAFFWGLKGGKKGGFTSDSSNTPLGRRTLVPSAKYHSKPRAL